MALREPTVMVLSALAGQVLHGYGLIEEVRALSGGRVTLSLGTLYGTLDRLTEDGLVRVEREEVVAGRLRRYYLLTDSGAGVLQAEVERMRQTADAADARLRTRAARPGLATA